MMSKLDSNTGCVRSSLSMFNTHECQALTPLQLVANRPAIAPDGSMTARCAAVGQMHPSAATRALTPGPPTAPTFQPAQNHLHPQLDVARLVLQTALYCSHELLAVAHASWRQHWRRAPLPDSPRRPPIELPLAAARVCGSNTAALWRSAPPARADSAHTCT